VTRTPNRRTNHTRRLLTTAAAISAFGIAALITPPAANADVAAGIGADEWALTYLNFNQAWKEAPNMGSGVTVAVIDSGVSPTQPDLSDSLVPGKNFLTNPPSNDTNDVELSGTDRYHGTGVASIIAGHAHADPSGPQGKGGMIGLAPKANIMPLVIGGGSGTISVSAEAEAVNYAVAQHVAVINLSISGDGSQELESAIQNALSHNIIVVAAAGNTGNVGNTVQYPAAYPGVVAVAAIDNKGKPWEDSQYGSYIALAAPGVHIARADGPTGELYGYSDGTSNAAPFVSAEAALLKSQHPSWTAGQIIQVMISTATSSSAGTRDPHLGYGIINPVKALTAAEPTSTANPLLAGSSPGASTAPSTGAKAANSSGSSTGMIVLIIVIVVILAIILLIVLLSRRGKNRRNPPGGPGAPGNWGPGYGNVPPQQQNYGSPQTYGNQPPQQYGPPPSQGRQQPPQNWGQQPPPQQPGGPYGGPQNYPPGR
jgi:type VII secretion-associated serine protease mycosin